LLEPGECPARVGVELALLLAQIFVQGLVDEGQQGPPFLNPFQQFPLKVQTFEEII
jgi:hypothetical protein